MEQKKSVFDKLEIFYLSALRIFLLVVSTALFAYASIIGISSLYAISRSPESVVEANPKIESSDIIPSDISSTSNTTDQSAQYNSTNNSKNEYVKSTFEQHMDRMFAIWSQKFEIHKKQSDPSLSSEDFSEWYSGAWDSFNKPQWCQEENCTDDELATAESDLKLAETTISEAASDNNLVARMTNAKTGTKDTYDQVFVDLNHNFWATLTKQRIANKEAADAKKAEITASKVAGGVGIATAGWAFAAFISLMFGFLLVAVERHQRKMASDIEEIKVNIENQ